MAEMISVREAAVRWNITERRVATLCKNGRIGTTCSASPLTVSETVLPFFTVMPAAGVWRSTSPGCLLGTLP